MAVHRSVPIFHPWSVAGDRRRMLTQRVALPTQMVALPTQRIAPLTPKRGGSNLWVEETKTGGGRKGVRRTRRINSPSHERDDGNGGGGRGSVECDVNPEQAEENRRHLVVMQSTIPDSGYGLFTNKYIKRCDTIAEYLGDRLTPAQHDAKYGSDPDIHAPYVVRLPNGEYIDAWREDFSNFARYANDCRPETRAYMTKLGLGACRNNALLISNSAGDRDFLVATEDIPSGSEVFVDYGGDYWGTPLQQRRDILYDYLRQHPQEGFTPQHLALAVLRKLQMMHGDPHLAGADRIVTETLQDMIKHPRASTPIITQIRDVENQTHINARVSLAQLSAPALPGATDPEPRRNIIIYGFKPQRQSHPAAAAAAAAAAAPPLAPGMRRARIKASFPAVRVKKGVRRFVASHRPNVAAADGVQKFADALEEANLHPVVRFPSRESCRRIPPDKDSRGLLAKIDAQIMSMINAEPNRLFTLHEFLDGLEPAEFELLIKGTRQWRNITDRVRNAVVRLLEKKKLWSAGDRLESPDQLRTRRTVMLRAVAAKASWCGDKRPESNQRSPEPKHMRLKTPRIVETFRKA